MFGGNRKCSGRGILHGSQNNARRWFCTYQRFKDSLWRGANSFISLFLPLLAVNNCSYGLGILLNLSASSLVMKSFTWYVEQRDMISLGRSIILHFTYPILKLGRKQKSWEYLKWEVKIRFQGGDVQLIISKGMIISILTLIIVLIIPTDKKDLDLSTSFIQQSSSPIVT